MSNTPHLSDKDCQQLVEIEKAMYLAKLHGFLED